MFDRRIVVAVAAGLVVGAGIGHLRMPADLAYSPKPPCVTEDAPGPCHWDARVQGNGQGTSFDAPPYCMYDAEVVAHITVAGPAGGSVTVDGRPAGTLALVTDADYGDEVRPDAELFSGIRYNVAGPGTVAVDGIGCVTT